MSALEIVPSQLNSLNTVTPASHIWNLAIHDIIHTLTSFIIMIIIKAG